MLVTCESYNYLTQVSLTVPNSEKKKVFNNLKSYLKKNKWGSKHTILFIIPNEEIIFLNQIKSNNSEAPLYASESIIKISLHQDNDNIIQEFSLALIPQKKYVSQEKTGLLSTWLFTVEDIGIKTGANVFELQQKITPRKRLVNNSNVIRYTILLTCILFSPFIILKIEQLYPLLFLIGFILVVFSYFFYVNTKNRIDYLYPKK